MARDLILKLPLSDYAKSLALYIIDNGFNLDTVSFSPQRGIALYFD